MDVELTVAAELASVIRIGAMTCDGVRVAEGDAPLGAALAGAEAALRQQADLDLGPARALYRAIGIDPTKTRPSSEALLRRVRKGEALPRINTAVDLGNWCSVEVQLPYGLYDLGRVEPPVQVRLGDEGEEYAGIRKDVVHLAGRLVVADRQGPFGNPSSDSARTMVTPAAQRVLVVVYAPASTAPAAMARVLDLTSRRFEQWAGGRETWRWVS